MSPATAAPLTYRRLQQRNRAVRWLRLLVPLLGAAVLVALLAQIIVSSLGGRFSVGSVSVSPEAVTVETPDYVGVMQDGSAYRVSAATARSATSRPDLIQLAEAKLVLNRSDGIQLTADAAQAQLDTTNQLTTVAGLAEISDSRGTTGTLRNSAFDWQAQVLTTNGAVAIDYADGSTVRAEGLHYDAATMVWSFTRSVVTLPSTPGADDAAPHGDTP